MPPSKLTIEELNVTLIVKFLNYLETERGNLARTRNARSAAIRAFFRFLEYRAVVNLEQCRQIHALPTKKIDEKLVDYLTAKEMQVILDEPDINTLSGIRDRAMIYLCFAAGLRVSELVGLCLEQFELNPQPAIHVIGKGRKERILPLWKETATVLKAWIAVRPNEKTTPSEIFLYSQGLAVTRSGFEYILSKHVKKTIKSIAIASKKTNFASRFTPFLRNTDT